MVTTQIRDFPERKPTKKNWPNLPRETIPHYWGCNRKAAPPYLNFLNLPKVWNLQPFLMTRSNQASQSWLKKYLW